MSLKTLPLDALWQGKKPIIQGLHGWSLPFTFTSLEDELATIKNNCGVIEFSWRGKVKISGTDSFDFLQRMLTQDLATLEAHQGKPCAFLNAQGRVLSYFYIWKQEDGFLLDTEMNQAEKLIEALDKFIITEDVYFSDETEKIIHLSFQGPNAKAFLDKEATQLRSQKSWISAEGYDLFLNKEEASKLIESAEGLTPIGYQSYEQLRVSLGILRHGVDFGEDIILSETGLEKGAVSFTKGCYPGQEVIAKIDTYKRLNREFKRVQISEDENPVLGPIKTDTFEGVITSISPKKDCGIVLVKRS